MRLRASPPRIGCGVQRFFYLYGLSHFTLRGKAKVNTQWQLYCLVHIIEKLAHHEYQ